MFYKGRAPHGQKTDWIMHEYRLEDADDPQGNPSVCLYLNNLCKCFIYFIDIYHQDRLFDDPQGS